MVISKTFDYIEDRLIEAKASEKTIQVTKGNEKGTYGGYGIIQKMFFNKKKRIIMVHLVNVKDKRSYITPIHIDRDTIRFNE
jgi:hypothetical protein